MKEGHRKLLKKWRWMVLSYNKKGVRMVKRWIVVGVTLLACLMVAGCGVPQEDYDAVVADTEAAKTQAASLQSQLDEVKSDLAEAEDNLAAVQNEVAAVQDDIEAAQDEAAAEESRASSAQSQVSSLKSQISSLESEIEAAEARIAQLEAAAAARAEVEAKLTESLKELRVGYPELFHELLKLPELEEIDARDDEAIEDIAELALDAEYQEAFESMLGEGIKDRRRYCTPLQALLWVAYERELRGYDALRGYSLTELIDDAWKNTTESKSYASERWQDFDEVVDRLNSPELIVMYLRDNFTYSYEYGEPEGVKSAEQIFNEKKGACYDHAVLAGYCLKMNGYDEVYGLKVRFERLAQGYFIGHIVLVFQGPADSLYYTVDNMGDPDSAVHGPFESVREAAEFTVREQGLEAYSLGNIDLEKAEYEAPCNYWPVEYSSVTEPVLEEGEEELLFEAATYTNEEYGFSVKYPGSWEEITRQHETTVFQVARPPSGVPGVSINVADIVEGVSFVDVCIAGLEEIGATDIQAISESETILADGTPASIVILQYTGGGYLTDGFVLVVEKDGKYIGVYVYTVNEFDPFSEEQMSEIAHTLRFE